MTWIDTHIRKHLHKRHSARARVLTVLTAHRYIPTAAAFLTCVSLAACGGGTSGNSTAHGGGTSSIAAAQGGGTSSNTAVQAAVQAGSNSSVVVARVGGHSITKGMLEHSMGIGTASKEVPEPPNYMACIAQLAKTPPDELPGPYTPAKLKSACQARYQEIKQHALQSLIISEWTIGEATEENLPVSEAVVRREFEQNIRRQFPKDGEFQRYLTTSGQTVADLHSNVRVQLASEKIFQSVANKEHGLTQAQISIYYANNKQRFAVPERRDVEIVRTGSKAEARKAEQEVRAGKSFADVVRPLLRRVPALEVQVGQPYGAKEGLVLGLVSGVYSQKPLNDAIFSAKPNVLSGPVKTVLGYYVFEVKRITPFRQDTLAGAEPSIKQQLPIQLHRHTLAAFVKAWRSKWTARTTCHRGYIVRQCREYKASKTTPPPDPYTLD